MSFHMKKISICLLLAAFICACSQKATLPDGVTTINVDVNNHVKDYDITSIYDTTCCKIVKLQNVADALIGGRIKKIFYREGYLFIWEEQTNTIFKYDDTGRYISKISSYGEGPQDYMSMASVYVTDDNIYIFDQVKRKILYYDYDCLYRGTINITSPKEGGFLMHDFFVMGDRVFMLNHMLKNGSPYSTHKAASMDMNGGDICCYLPLGEDEMIPYSLYLHKQDFTSVNDRVHFMCLSTDTFYVATGNGVGAEYVLDFGENTLPKESYTENPAMLYTTEYDKYVKGIKSFIETNTHIIFCFEYGRLPRFSPDVFDKETGGDPIKGEERMRTKWPTTLYHLIYDKNTGKSILANGIKTEYYGLYRMGFTNVDGSYSFNVFYPETLPSSYGKNKYFSIPLNTAYEKQLNDIYSSLTIDDNPVICIYKFKDVEKKSILHKKTVALRATVFLCISENLFTIVR